MTQDQQDKVVPPSAELDAVPIWDPRRMHQLVEECIHDYEFDDGEACYAPDDQEKMLLLDCAVGIADQVIELFNQQMGLLFLGLTQSISSLDPELRNKVFQLWKAAPINDKPYDVVLAMGIEYENQRALNTRPCGIVHAMHHTIDGRCGVKHFTTFHTDLPPGYHSLYLEPKVAPLPDHRPIRVYRNASEFVDAPRPGEPYVYVYGDRSQVSIAGDPGRVVADFLNEDEALAYAQTLIPRPRVEQGKLVDANVGPA